MTRNAGLNSHPNRPKADNPSTMKRPSGSIFSKRAAQPRRQHSRQHAPAVERRNGQQIEHRKHDVDHDACLRHGRDPAVQCLVAVDPGKYRQHRAPERPPSRDSPTGPASATRIIARRGLRRTLVATGTGFAQPNRGPPAASNKPGTSNGTDGIDVAQRIQTQASQHLGGAVTEVSGHPAVCDFVQGDRKQDRDCPNRYLVEKCR